MPGPGTGGRTSWPLIVAELGGVLYLAGRFCWVARGHFGKRLANLLSAFWDAWTVSDACMLAVMIGLGWLGGTVLDNYRRQK